MCMITFLPDGQLADRKAILNGIVSNDDGHGFAVVADDDIVVRRGLDGKSMLDQFIEMREQFPHGPAVFHSRWATHGGVDKSNIHPFYVGGDKRTIIVHNGIFSGLSDWKAVRSDTRVFAESFLPKRQRKMSLLTRRGRRAVEQWMGKFNKVAVLTVDNRAQGNSFLLNESEGVWFDGSWYSNTGFLDSRPLYAVGKSIYMGNHSESTSGWDSLGWGTDDDKRYNEYWEEHYAESLKCEFCLCVGAIDSATSECMVCGMCQDCSQPGQACQCYIPPERGTATIG